MAQTYTVRRSKKARYMRLAVRPGGEVVLTAPERFPLPIIEKFLAQHAEWIERSVRKMRGLKSLPAYGRREYKARREAARRLVHERLLFWNSFYHFKYNRVAIKNTRSLWGSCSRRGNLNFSYALVHLPRELADYVVVHELCHLREANHGPRFWALVAKAIPDYARRRRELRTYVLKK